MSNTYSLTRLDQLIQMKKEGKDVSKFQITYPVNEEEAHGWDYKYWKTKPVTQLDNRAVLPRIIDDNYLEKYKDKPETKLPSQYQWSTYDINNNDDLEKVSNFLTKFYGCENNKSKFAHEFTPRLLKWLLINGFIYGVEAITETKSENNTENNTENKVENKIVAVICGRIQRMQLFNLETNTVQITHTCVHPKLREKKLLQILIEETIRRQANNSDCKVGCFNTMKYIPKPVCKTENYNRAINYERLYKTGFVKLVRKDKNTEEEELELAINEYKVRTPIKRDDSPIVVRMDQSNVEKAHEILCEYQDKYNIYDKYTLEEFKERFMNSDVCSSYVLIKNDEVKDFFSYYHHSMINVENKQSIRITKMYLYSSNEITPLTIYKYAIYHASKENADLFTCTDCEENLEVVYDNFNKFQKGNTYAYFNFFNWECAELSPEQVCLTPVN